jgi:carboxymethylenebutenolidase
MAGSSISRTTVDVETPDGPMPLFVASPEAPASRGVVVVQEAFGVNPYIESVAERFAAAGYLAVAPHFFHRAGGGTVPYGDFTAVLEKFEGLTDGGILDDVDAALAHVAAAGVPAAATGLVGFCFGGRVAFLAALRRPIGAAVGFYGGGIVTGRFPQFPALIDEAPTLQTPWLGLFGADDASIPVADVDRLRDELAAKAPVATDVVLYDGAGHGFFRDVSDDFRPDAATDAWTRTTGWFATHLAAD